MYITGCKCVLVYFIMRTSLNVTVIHTLIATPLKNVILISFPDKLETQNKIQTNLKWYIIFCVALSITHFSITPLSNLMKCLTMPFWVALLVLFFKLLFLTVAKSIPTKYKTFIKISEFQPNPKPFANRHRKRNLVIKWKEVRV